MARARSRKRGRVSGKRFNRVHAVCTYLRHAACLKCPARVQSPYGPGTAGCYLIAKEVINIAHHGSPWPVYAKAANVKKWRQRFNRYGE